MKLLLGVVGLTAQGLAHCKFEPTLVSKNPTLFPWFVALEP